ncbi:ThiF family adenylyltransferase [Brevundimonas sanguinis]|uniref:ThiF family adenylyltransferase n=1 Tax=Brevundimonas sanguinis TaxID=3021811 RepID=UPI0024155C92|nr:ThiF family adenylyltransferase [Brevundimonas sp. NCCP 15609]
MTIWYFTDAARLGAEHQALRDLAGRVDWLSLNAPRLDGFGRVCVDIEISANERVYNATLRYPHTFPHSPPSVLPTERESWSGHQYGDGGELCLEWGADNWVTDLTGAHMVESAERLLSGEAPKPTGGLGRVPSRHETTIGQTLRSRTHRLVITQAFAEQMRSLPDGWTANGKLLWVENDKRRSILPVRLVPDDGEDWIDASVPKALSGSGTLHGMRVWRLPRGVKAPSPETASEMRAFMDQHSYCAPSDDAGLLDLLLTWDDNGAQLLLFAADSDEVYDVAMVEAQGGDRLPTSHRDLATKSVGIVGCGSAGSKIAVALARAGVGRLVLVDDDVLLPENLVRNELDWTSVGDHKANAVAKRIDLVAPGAVVEVHLKRLAAQEASGVADGVLYSLQKCDLVVDATAEPSVFNLLAGIASMSKRSMLWLEIFAGGFGGLIARSRPDLDPSPQRGRAAIEAWCADRGVSPPRVDRPYEASDELGPMIADDTDVSVIAAHAAQMALDMLAETSPSAFPNSAYLIGLREKWIFTQPLHTHAIDLGGPDAPSAAADPKTDADGLALALTLVKDFCA